MSTGGRSISRKRLVLVDALIGFTTLLAILGLFAIWANRQLLNPDNWANTSTQLLQNAAVRDATANYVVDQLYANVNVPGLIGSALPPRLKPLAGPAAGALRSAAVQGATLALSRPRVQSLWATANRAADQTFVTIVNGGKGAVKISGGVVTLNLASIVNDIAARLGLPSGLGSKLPASIANLQVLKSSQISLVQDIGSALKGLALWLTIIVPLLYALAIALAQGHRRRTLMSVGFAILVAGVLVLFGRSLLESQVPPALVKDASIRPAAEAVVSIGTTMLSEIAGAFVIVGAVLVVAAWFAGAARPAVAMRRAIAPFLRQNPGPTYGITVAVMVLIFIWQPIPATGKPAGMIVFLLLALFGTEVLRRQTAAEFPNAQAGDTMRAFRARAQRRSSGQQTASGPAQAQTIPQQIEHLAALRDSGSISPEDYDAAKAALVAKTGSGT